MHTTLRTAPSPLTTHCNTHTHTQCTYTHTDTHHTTTTAHITAHTHTHQHTSPFSPTAFVFPGQFPVNDIIPENQFDIMINNHFTNLISQIATFHAPTSKRAFKTKFSIILNKYTQNNSSVSADTANARDFQSFFFSHGFFSPKNRSSPTSLERWILLHLHQSILPSFIPFFSNLHLVCV